MKSFFKLSNILATLLVVILSSLAIDGIGFPLPDLTAVVEHITLSVNNPGVQLGMGMMVSLPKGIGALRQGGPAGIKDVAHVFRWSDVLVKPVRDENGVLVEADIIMKPGTFMAELYGTQSTIELKETTEGNADQEADKTSLMLVHPGSYLEVQEWYKANRHENLGLIIERCSGENELLGDCCNGLRIKREKTMNGTETSNKFTFEAPVAGDVAAIYRGAITKEGFVATASADATTISVAAGTGRYRTGVNTVATALTGLTGAAHGKTYSLVGNSGAHPTSIAASATIILKDGTSFSLIDGAQITFRAFKSGESSFVFIEQSRS